jgi:hypothetical protein
MMSPPATSSSSTRQPRLILPIVCFRAILLPPGPWDLLRFRFRRLLTRINSRERGCRVNPKQLRDGE